MSASIAMARGGAGAFTPLKLSGLLYYVDPDYNADVATAPGSIDSIVDRYAALSFQAPASGQRPTEDNAEKTSPAHRVASTDTTDRLENSSGSAQASALVSADWSFAVFFRSLSNSSVNFIWQHYANTAGTGHTIGVCMGDGVSGSSTGMSVRVRDSGGFGTARVAFTRDTTTWHLIVVNYVFSTRTATIYKDNSSQGSAALDVSRDPVGLNHSVVYGGGTASLSAKMGPQLAKLGVMSSTDRTNLYNWGLATGWI